MMSSENIQALMFMSVTHSFVLLLAEESSFHQKDDHALTMTVVEKRCLLIQKTTEQFSNTSKIDRHDVMSGTEHV
jgi:hypothetical protein